MSIRTTAPRTAIRRIALARAISFTGGAAAFMALNFSIFKITGSYGWLAATLFLTFGVVGLAGPVAGMIADRFDRRRVMIASDLFAAVLFAVMGFVHAPGVLVALAFGSALAETPFRAASGAAIPNLVGDEGQLGWANGLVTLGANVGILLGPLIGGILVAGSSAQAVFLANAVSFVLSAAIVATVHGSFRRSRPSASPSAEHQGMSAGFRFLFHDRVLRTIVLAWVAIVLGGCIAMVADVPLAQLFGVSSWGYGVMIACWGGGSIIGSLCGRWVTERREAPALFAGAAACALGTAAVAISAVFWPVAVAILVAGFGDAFMSVAGMNMFQRRAPDAVRGRVMAAQDALIQIAMALSLGVAAFVLLVVHPRGAYLVGGATAVGAAVLLIPVRRWTADERRVSSQPAIPAGNETDRLDVARIGMRISASEAAPDGSL
jgi:MFS family permease